MAIDAQAAALHAAGLHAIQVGKIIMDLADGVLQPVAGSVQPSAATIAAIKAEAIVALDEWDDVVAEMAAAKTA